jgi:TfoX/Sxy family transcriptional regulator of competence genes
VTYDEDLADRVRDELCDLDSLTERKMFGGLAFLIGGHMAIVASGQGGLLARVDPDTADHAVEAGTAQLAVMRNREMRGWLRITADDVATSRALRKWTDLSRTFVATLPPKD